MRHLVKIFAVGMCSIAMSTQAQEAPIPQIGWSLYVYGGGAQFALSSRDTGGSLDTTLVETYEGLEIWNASTDPDTASFRTGRVEASVRQSFDRVGDAINFVFDLEISAIGVVEDIGDGEYPRPVMSELALDATVDVSNIFNNGLWAGVESGSLFVEGFEDLGLGYAPAAMTHAFLEASITFFSSSFR